MNTAEMIPVSWRPNPFSETVCRQFAPRGKTIAAIVDSIPDLPIGFGERGVVKLNGRTVPCDLWRGTRVKVDTKCEVAITLHLAPANTKTLALVASVAILVAAVAVSQGALAALIPGSAAYLGAGTVGATVAALGTSVCGTLEINALRSAS